MPTYIGNKEVYNKYIGNKNIIGQFVGSDNIYLNHHKEDGTDSVSFLSLGYPIQEYKVSGKVTQNGTPSVQAKTLELGTLVQDSYVSNTDGVITPYSSWDRTDYIAIPVDMKHITVEVDSTYNNKYNCWYDENKQFISSFTIWNASSGTKILTADVPANAKYVIFSAPRNWMESASVTYNAIQPIPVQGVGDRTAQLFDYQTMAHGTDGMYLDENGSMQNSNAWAVTDFIPCNGSAFTLHAVGGGAPAICLYDAEKRYIIGKRYNTGGAATKSDITITSQTDATFIRFSWYRQDDLTKIMLNAGSTVLPHEPYGYYKIPISSNGTTVATMYLDKPLYGIGASTDYLQRLSDGSGVEHRAWRELVLTGEENDWLKAASYAGCFYKSTALSAVQTELYCTHLPYIAASGFEQGTITISTSKRINLWFEQFDGNTTIAEFKSYLAEQYAAGTPVTVVYQLATPTDTPIPKGKSYGENLTKVDDYMYNIVYNEIDRAYAKEFIRNNYFNIAGACSSVRKGNFFGRNYDWKYDNTAYYIVNVTHEAAKYSSIGIAGGFSRMTNDFAESGETSDLYRVLPYATLDGINEKGVVANINVVPAGDKGRTTGTTPTGEHRETLCQMSLVRYVLDNFATAQDAVDDIVAHVSVYAPNVAGAGELHLMIADANNTFVIEFINNQTVVRDMESYYDGRTYMTNFYLDGTTVNSDNHINFSSVTDYGSGLERYNIISDGFNNINSVATMTELMTSLNFTNAYQSNTSPAWNTEFVSEEMGLTVHSASSDFEPIVNAAIAGFADATRNGKYWITCHTSVYDIQAKKMYLIFQENSSSTQREIAYRTYQSTISSIPAIETATQENTLTVDTTVSPSALSVMVRGGDSVSVMQNVFVDAHGVIFTTADGVPFGFEEV